MEGRLVLYVSLRVRQKEKAANLGARQNHMAEQTTECYIHMTVTLIIMYNVSLNEFIIQTNKVSGRSTKQAM